MHTPEAGPAPAVAVILVESDGSERIQFAGLEPSSPFGRSLALAFHRDAFVEGELIQRADPRHFAATMLRQAVRAPGFGEWFAARSQAPFIQAVYAMARALRRDAGVVVQHLHPADPTTRPH